MSEERPEYKSEDLASMLTKGIEGYKKGKSDQAEAIRIERVRVFSKPDQQELFINKYIKLDSWNLFSEALPILIGYRPEYINYAKLDSKYKELETLARSSTNITLKILNKDEPEEKWRVLPKEVVKWANLKDIEILYLLKELYSEKEKKKVIVSSTVHPTAERHAANREPILIAALAVLAKYPEQCKDNGEVSASKIYSVMMDKSLIWFEDGEPPLEERTIKEMINSALNTVR
jgi:hypothetical protein